MKTLILLNGLARSGKNALSSHLKEILQLKGYKVEEKAFADSLKEYCKEDFKSLQNILSNIIEEVNSNVFTLFNTREEMFNKNQFEIVKNSINKIKFDENNWNNNKTEITRCLIQTYGTNIVRNRVDKDYWVNHLKNDTVSSDSDFVIVTDVRFENEITGFFSQDFLKEFNIITIRVDRNINNNDIMYAHESENSLNNWESWDFIVDNNGSLYDLKLSANEIISWIFKLKDNYVNYFTGKPFGLLT